MAVYINPSSFNKIENVHPHLQQMRLTNLKHILDQVPNDCGCVSVLPVYERLHRLFQKVSEGIPCTTMVTDGVKSELEQHMLNAFIFFINDLVESSKNEVQKAFEILRARFQALHYETRGYKMFANRLLKTTADEDMIGILGVLPCDVLRTIGNNHL